MKTCGTCEHAKTNPGLPLGGRLCKGAPPQAILVPVQGQAGVWQLQWVWPPVATQDEACGAWKPKGLTAINGPYNPVPLKAAAEAIDIARRSGDDDDADLQSEAVGIMEALSGH